MAFCGELKSNKLKRNSELQNEIFAYSVDVTLCKRIFQYWRYERIDIVLVVVENHYLKKTSKKKGLNFPKLFKKIGFRKPSSEESSCASLVPSSF